MPRIIDRVGAENLDHYEAPLRYNKTTEEAAITDLQVILDLTDAQLTPLLPFITPGVNSVAEFRSFITAERQGKIRIVRQWSLDTVTLELEDLISTYLLFDTALGGAVQSKCGEEVSGPATNVLANAGKWAHLTDEAHSIVLDLGTDETIDGISIPIEAGANATHQLRGVNVNAAKALPKIDDTENRVLTDVDFATVDAANEITFPSHRAQFVKLSNITTDHNSNSLRIGSILIRVNPKFFGEE